MAYRKSYGKRKSYGNRKGKKLTFYKVSRGGTRM